MKSIYSNEMFQNQMNSMADIGIPLIAIGMYVMYGAAIPLLFAIGNYLIHKGTKGESCAYLPEKIIRNSLYCFLSPERFRNRLSYYNICPVV